MRIGWVLAAVLLGLCSSDGRASAATAPRAVDLGSVTLRVPGSWQRQPVSTPFRRAQYAIPRAPGDTAPASFIVFYFGPGQGGSAEANIQRWIGMVRQPNGKDSHTVAHRAQLQRPGLRISTLDVSGTYMESPNPFTSQVIPRPHSRMLAAVVEVTKPSSAGSYFLRLVGPARTITAAKPGWDALLASVRAK